MMNRPRPQMIDSTSGLIAHGASDHGEVSIDESLDEEGRWEAEIDGPKVYLGYSFGDLGVVGRALRYLQARPSDDPTSINGKVARDAGLVLGTFGPTDAPSDVTLIRDDESPDRCFIIVGPAGNSSIRWTLLQQDIEMLTRALELAVEQLPVGP